MSSGTNITGITKSTVAVTPAPDWGTNLNTSLDAIDAHDHTSNKGVRITPSAMNINGTLEFNDNAITEVKQSAFQNQSSQPTDQLRALYSFGGELYYRDASGNQVQLTTGGNVNAGGSITNLASPAKVNYVVSSDIFTFQHNENFSEYAKMAFSSFQLYNYRTDDSSSGVNYFVTVQYTGTGTSGTLTLPDETGTVLTTATSFGGGNLSVTATSGQIDLSASSTLDLATSAGNSNITLSPHGTGEVVVGNGGASGKISSSGNFDLVLETGNSTTGNVTLTDGADGDITLTPNGAGTVTVGTKLKVTGNEILASDGGTAITMDTSDNVTIGGDLTVTGNDIKSSGATVLTMSGANATFAGTVTLNADPSSALQAATKSYADSQAIIFSIALG
tara:strand:+ start:61 stop:1233 length:1173 start_codon:yes stop_codon:yes gene_type:complete